MKIVPSGGILTGWPLSSAIGPIIGSDRVNSHGTHSHGSISRGIIDSVKLRVIIHSGRVTLRRILPIPDGRRPLIQPRVHPGPVCVISVSARINEGGIRRGILGYEQNTQDQRRKSFHFYLPVTIVHNYNNNDKVT